MKDFSLFKNISFHSFIKQTTFSCHFVTLTCLKNTSDKNNYIYNNKQKFFKDIQGSVMQLPKQIWLMMLH